MMLTGAILLAQLQGGISLTGKVVRTVGADTIAASGAIVVLHQVSDESQGPIDSIISNQDGEFRFTVVPDTTAVLLVSARWAGIEYFAPPPDGTPSLIVVSDTSSSVPVTIAARHIIVGGPAPDGTRDVVDLLVIRNSSRFTHVAADSASPTAWVLVPALAANLQLGDADFALDAFDRHGDTLMLNAPIPPGDRQFFLQYQLAPGTTRFVVPMVPGVDTLTVLAEESDLRATPAFTRIDVQEVEGREFTRWATGRSQGQIELSLPGRTEAPRWLLAAMVITLGVGLLGTLAWSLLPRRS
jgi:hypothetical protein